MTPPLIITLMTLLLLIISYILDKNRRWFHGAHTVGVICLTVGLVCVAIQLALFLGAL